MQTRSHPSPSILSTVLALGSACVGILCALVPTAAAQPAMTHARDAEVRWANDLPLDDLRDRALLHVIVGRENLTVRDGNRSMTGQRLGILTIDFGKKVVLDLSGVDAMVVDQTTGRRTLRVEAPRIAHKAKKIEFEFKKDFHDDEKLRDDDYKCKLEHPLPLEPDTVLEIFLVEGVELKYHCIDRQLPAPDADPED